MSFDKIFDLTAGVYFHFYNISISRAHQKHGLMRRLLMKHHPLDRRLAGSASTRCCDGLGWVGLVWFGLVWVGLGWVGLGWAGWVGWVGLRLFG